MVDQTKSLLHLLSQCAVKSLGIVVDDEDNLEATARMAAATADADADCSGVDLLSSVKHGGTLNKH